MNTLIDLLVALMGSTRNEAHQAAKAHHAYLSVTDPQAAHDFAKAWESAQALCPSVPTLLGTCKIGHRTAKVYRTQGIDGLVLGSTFPDESVFLRVNHDINGQGRGFTDYQWRHDDPSVRLIDELSVLYVYEDGSAKFDHAPSVLGLMLDPSTS